MPSVFKNFSLDLTPAQLERLSGLTIPTFSPAHVRPATKPERCPDCKGSGKYVGLVTVEPCRLCSGDGTI